MGRLVGWLLISSDRGSLRCHVPPEIPTDILLFHSAHDLVAQHNACNPFHTQSKSLDVLDELKILQLLCN